MNKHGEHCKSIVDDLVAYVDGRIFSYNGDIYDVDDFEVVEHDGIDCYLIDDEYVDIDDVENLSIYDYFDDYYNIDYILDSYKELKAVRVMVACGGPNIYINTYDGVVELFWWTENGKAYIPQYVSDEINAMFSEFFNM